MILFLYICNGLSTIVTHYMTKLTGTLNSFFILFWSLTYTLLILFSPISIHTAHIIVLSIPIHIHSHFSISSYYLWYFIHHTSDLLYLVLDSFRPLSLIFISIFISDFVLHFYWYSICSITLYVDTTIYSPISILDFAFRLFDIFILYDCMSPHFLESASISVCLFASYIHTFYWV